MDTVRVFFDDNGAPVAVETRPDQKYADESIADHLRSYRSEVMTTEQAKLRLPSLGPDGLDGPNASAARVKEIRDTDKSALADDEWIKLFREYVTLTGAF